MKELDDAVSTAFDIQENANTIILSYSLRLSATKKQFNTRSNMGLPSPLSLTIFRQKRKKRQRVAPPDQAGTPSPAINSGHGVKVSTPCHLRSGH